MVGICGVVDAPRHDVGEVVDAPRHDVDGMAQRLVHRGTETTTRWADDRLTVSVVDHDDAVESQPATATDGTRIWVWGELFGYETDGGYVARTGALAEMDDAAYAARRYDEDGAAFVDGLYGEFAGLCYGESGDVTLFTDRLGARPLYHARTDAGELVFATTLQALPAYPGLAPSFDREYLSEFLARKGAFGIETPLSGVRQTHPGALTHVDQRGAVRTERYWVPEYRPSDASFATAVEEFVTRFRAAVRERVDPDAEYGVLLSGGVDSRLSLAVLAETGVSVTAYHMNEWRNDEARIAERAAETAGVEFRFLERDADYQRRALARNPALSDFVSEFYQAHATGFADVLTEEVDALVTGHYAGEAVGRFTDFPLRRLDTPLGTVELPLERPVRTVADYVEFLDCGLPEYLETPPSLADVLRANIRTEGERIVHHGVAYPSLRDAVLFSELYPLTNDSDYLNYVELVQMLPHWTPFLDERVVDFATRLPVQYRVRRNVVNRALKRVDPELAAIPYANTGVPVGYPLPFHYVASNLRLVREKYFQRDRPRPHFSHGSWTDHGELVRTDDFLLETLEKHEGVLEDLAFVDRDGVFECYRRHLAGAHNRLPLCTLATVLEMPITDAVARNTN